MLAGLGPFAIAPLHKTAITLQFTPTVISRGSANLNIISTDPHHPTFEVALIGRGVGGHLIVNLPAPIPPATMPKLGFGTVAKNTTLIKTFTVTNSGRGVLSGSVGGFAIAARSA